MSDVLVVGSRIKAVVKKQGMRAGGEVLGALSKHIDEILRSAVRKAQEDKRETVKERDVTAAVQQFKNGAATTARED